MSRIIKSLLIAVLFLLFLPLFTIYSRADSGFYTNYNVTVDIENDSTFLITEDVSINFTGTFRKVFRGITLKDFDTEELCINDPSMQCGGFEYLEFLGFFDPLGTRVPDEQYLVETVNESGEDRLKVTWNFAPEGRIFNSEVFNYKIKYKVYGGLGFFDDYDLFYWDMLPPERPTSIPDSRLTFNFPANYSPTENDLKVMSYFNAYDYEITGNGSSIVLNIKNILALDDLTIALKLPKGMVNEPATLKIKSTPDPINISVNGVLIEDVSKELKGIPQGKTTLTFSQDGYLSESMDVELSSGEIKDVEVALEMDPFAQMMLIVLVVSSICLCLLLPLSLFLIYLHWYRRGRDAKYKDTIVPQYSPPDEVRPYLLGSVKDEKVDMVDISATIIDTAVRKYIKIREFEGKSVLGFKGKSDYELIKLKDFKTLNSSEKTIMDSIFSGKERVLIPMDLENVFYLKIPEIVKGINQEMVARGYFKEDPDTTRNRYRAIGSTLLVLSIFGIFTLSALLFIPPFFILIMDIVLIAVALLIVSNFMPAKSLEGSKLLNEIKGFRMYLHTAERFRVQDLTPDTFEKFLPYAMVFGIEKEWAERFKDIYKAMPDWYESSSLDTFNTIYLINSLSTFQTNTVNALTYIKPTKTYSSSSGRGFGGGGWSGGGGFGGSFGGGGGGGGSSGWG